MFPADSSKGANEKLLRRDRIQPTKGVPLNRRRAFAELGFSATEADNTLADLVKSGASRHNVRLAGGITPSSCTMRVNYQSDR
jgi:hypothetical protein